MSEPVSGSVYIIVCNGRIEVTVAGNDKDKIVAASRTATKVVSFIESTHDDFNPVDALSISQLQHQLMDHLTGVNRLSHDEVQHKIDAMFEEFDTLEDKY